MSKYGRYIMIRALDKYVLTRLSRDIISFYKADDKYFKFIKNHVRIANDPLIKGAGTDNSIWIHPLIVLDYARKNNIKEVENEIYFLLEDDNDDLNLK